VLIAVAIVLGLSSVGAGGLIAVSTEDERVHTPSVSRGVSPSDAPSVEPGESPEPSGPDAPGPSGSPVLEDGRHFVYVRRASDPDVGRTTVRFDLAYFYTGERAEREAAERGDELVNDYYIVNDNPLLRTLPLADEVEVAYIPGSRCCEPEQWDIDSWLEAIGLSTNPIDSPGKNVPWWFTVEGGQITEIEQQYLP
jgi:hypothetical protein